MFMAIYLVNAASYNLMLYQLRAKDSILFIIIIILRALCTPNLFFLAIKDRGVATSALYKRNIAIKTCLTSVAQW